MKITALKAQVRVRDRINVFVDGSFRFSLDASQLLQLGVRVGKEYSETELQDLENESQYGKLYMRALEYSLVRPRSVKEIKDYLYRKTRDVRTKDGGVRKGVPVATTRRVLDALLEKHYVDDRRFAQFWLENRDQRKGTSLRRLRQELIQKGVDPDIIEAVMRGSDRNDATELKKVIEKKAKRYDDEQKLVQYLVRRGFSYDDVQRALQDEA